MRPKKGASQVILLQVSWCKLHGTIAHNNIKGRRTCQRQNLWGKCALLSANYLRRLSVIISTYFPFSCGLSLCISLLCFFSKLDFLYTYTRQFLPVCQFFWMHDKKTSQDNFLCSESKLEFLYLFFSTDNFLNMCVTLLMIVSSQLFK